MPLSTNGIALILFLLSAFGIQVSEQTVVEMTAAVVQIVSFIVMVRNQWKRPDVKGFIFK